MSDVSRARLFDDILREAPVTVTAPSPQPTTQGDLSVLMRHAPALATFVGVLIVLLVIRPPCAQRRERDGLDATRVLLVTAVATVAVLCYPFLQRWTG